MRPQLVEASRPDAPMTAPDSHGANRPIRQRHHLTEPTRSAMGKYTVGNFRLRVGRSRTGRGMFACEDIPKGACIIEYIGPEATEEEMERDRNRYLFSVGKKKTINGYVRENRARFINHSCKPNCEAEGPNGRVFIMARRKIKAGEELTYNYGKEYFERFIKPKGCKCPKCDAP
jgi:RNase P protein component